MSVVELDGVKREGFTISPALEGQTIRIVFSGNADMDANVALGAFLRRLQEHALEKKARRVMCDFRALYFMNSSCFKCFVVWIDEVASSSPEQQYAVELVGNPNMHWQARSIESLRYLAPSVVSVRTAS